MGGGGGEERSVPGIPASSKNPSNPAGTMNSNVLASFAVAFPQTCNLPFGMWKIDPAFTVKARSVTMQPACLSSKLLCWRRVGDCGRLVRIRKGRLGLAGATPKVTTYLLTELPLRSWVVWQRPAQGLVKLNTMNIENGLY